MQPTPPPLAKHYERKKIPGERVLEMVLILILYKAQIMVHSLTV